MAEVPQWFTSEVARRLRRVRRVAGTLQHYACCPVPSHSDQTASMGIRPGDKMTLVFNCKKGCDEEEIRQALADLGVPDEYLGAYGTPEYSAVRRARIVTAERRKLDRIASLLHEPLTPAMLKIRIQAVIEGIEVPTERKEFLALAVRAGVKRSQRYEAWAQVCDTTGSPEPVSDDHVVLTRPAENRQALQASAHPADPETGLPVRKPDGGSSGNRTTDETDTAVEVLRSAGLTVRPDKPAA